MNGNPNDYKPYSGARSMRYIDSTHYVEAVKRNGLLPMSERSTDVFRETQLHEAIMAAGNAYAPYSRFHVGAALLTDSGRIFAGCNVENAMFNGMSHAELTAISAAITALGPSMKIQEMTIWTPTATPTPSCGACRQLIREHAENMDVTIWSYCDSPDIAPLGLKINQLLPHSFGPENL